jgi:nucleotide-binding universal stress UspA family protein
MFQHILVPIDGSPHARQAVDCAADIAIKYDASLSLLHVITNVMSSRVPDELREYADVEHIELSERDMLLGIATKLMDTAKARARELGVSNINASIETGNPAPVIVRYCDDNDIDLIVMGRRGLGDLGGLMIGSVSHKVAHLSDCACMTVV